MGKGVHLFLGSMVHDTLERHYELLQQSKLLTEEELIEVLPKSTFIADKVTFSMINDKVKSHIQTLDSRKIAILYGTEA